jgi:putative restriction endonuclease
MQQGQASLEVRDDAAMRLAAFDHVRRLAARDGALESSTIAAGFTFQGARVPLVNPQRGIFKPRGLPLWLSTRTVIPRAGARLWYDDPTQAHRLLEALT